MENERLMRPVERSSARAVRTNPGANLTQRRRVSRPNRHNSVRLSGAGVVYLRERDGFLQPPPNEPTETRPRIHRDGDDTFLFVSPGIRHGRAKSIALFPDIPVNGRWWPTPGTVTARRIPFADIVPGHYNSARAYFGSLSTGARVTTATAYVILAVLYGFSVGRKRHASCSSCRPTVDGWFNRPLFRIIIIIIRRRAARRYVR